MFCLSPQTVDLKPSWVYSILLGIVHHSLHVLMLCLVKPDAADSGKVCSKHEIRGVIQERVVEFLCFHILLFLELIDVIGTTGTRSGTFSSMTSATRLALRL